MRFESFFMRGNQHPRFSNCGGLGRVDAGRSFLGLDPLMVGALEESPHLPDCIGSCCHIRAEARTTTVQQMLRLPRYHVECAIG